MRELEALLPFEKLESYGRRTDEYRNANPFPHIVIDNFLKPEVATELIRDFPGPNDHAWLKFRAPAEKNKLQSTSELDMPSSARSMIAALNSSTFVQFLERLTGIDGIIPDPHLFGGGLHQTLPWGHLKMHVDYNVHEKWQLARRLNLLLYLNEDWQETWGGALELWDSDRATRKMTRCARKIYPIANRLVIFSTDEHSWHGHPDALACPPSMTRKSIALYYYSNGRPASEVAPKHGTTFKERPGERFRYVTWKDVMRDMVPPLIMKVARRIRDAAPR